MSNSVGTLAVLVTGDSSPFAKALDDAAKKVDGFGAQVRAKFSRMTSQIAQNKLEMTPFNLKKMVGGELALEDSTKQLSQAKALERLRQTGGTSVGGLVQNAFGGKFQETVAGLKEAGGGSILKGIGSALEGSGGASEMIGGLASQLGELAAVATPVTAAIAGVTAVTVGAVVGFKKLGDTIASYVGKFSPASAERYFRVFEDLDAVLGSRLVPVLDTMTAGWRIVADTLHTVLPSPQEIEAIFRPLRESLEDLRGPISWIVNTVKPVAKLGIGALGNEARALGFLSNMTFGGIGGAAPSLANSTGMAAGSASYVSNPSDIGRDAVLAALSVNNGAQDPAVQTATNTERMVETLAEIKDTLAQYASSLAIGAGSALAPVGFGFGR